MLSEINYYREIKECMKSSNLKKKSHQLKAKIAVTSNIGLFTLLIIFLDILLLFSI